MNFEARKGYTQAGALAVGHRFGVLLCILQVLDDCSLPYM